MTPNNKSCPNFSEHSSALRRMKVSCGVAFVTAEPTLRILLLKRAAHVGNALTWGLPGGQREPSEKSRPLFATAQRECMEEIGLSPASHTGAFSVQRPGSKVYHVFCIPVTMATSDIHVELLDGEHVDYAWVSLEAPEVQPLHPVVDALLAKHASDLRRCASGAGA